MSASRSALTIALYTVLDAGLALVLLTRSPSAWGLVVMLWIHVVVSLMAAFALVDRTPRFVKATRHEVISTCAVFTICVPVLGAIGVWTAVRFGLTSPREPSAEQWVAFDVGKDVMERQRHPLRNRRAMASPTEIREVLEQRDEGTTARRFELVLAIQKLPPRVGVPLLKIAQSDPSDEIRLYAFSRLERMRDDLERKVKEISSAVETATGAEGARLHLRLAQSYWELGYLGLAEGAVLAHALKSAHRHAAIASEQLPMHAPAEFFLGRILLHLREPERAAMAFERAMRAGYPRVKVLPWLAECAFYERDFAAVTSLLTELDAISPENVFFQPVSELWVRSHRSPRPPRGSRESLHISSQNKFERSVS